METYFFNATVNLRRMFIVFFFFVVIFQVFVVACTCDGFAISLSYMHIWIHGAVAFGMGIPVSAHTIWPSHSSYLHVL